MKFEILRRILKQYFYDAKLRNKLITAYSILIISAILFVGLVAGNSSKKYLIESEKTSLLQSMNQLNNSLDYFFEIYMDRTNMTFNNEDLQNILEKPISNIEDAVEANIKIEKICQYIKNDIKYPGMRNSYYFGGNLLYQIYTSNDTITAYRDIALPLEDVKNEKWVKELNNEKIVFKWQNGQNVNGIPYLALNRRLISFQSTQIIGILQILIPVSRITNVIESNIHTKSQNVLYLDDNFNIITSTGDKKFLGDLYMNEIKNLKLKQGINEAVINNEKFIIGYLKSDSTGWGLVYITSVDEITEKTSMISLITLITIVIALIVCFIITFIISSFITKRINILVDKTNMIDANNMLIDIKVKGNDEIGKLDENFNKMVDRINDLIEKEFKAKITINQTRLELLQEQINPHLLYNTLAAVGYAAKKAGQKKILGVADNLTNFYKGILNRGKIISSLKEELEMVKRYVEIMEFVYNLEIDTIFDIEEEVMKYYSLKLIIQPIVENSILHGIKPKKTGTIAISAYILDETVQIVVSDDGLGMDSKICEDLNQLTTRADVENGFGLRNIIKRIQIFFGDSYSVKFKSTKDEGTTVTMRIPKLTASDIENLIKNRFPFE